MQQASIYPTNSTDSRETNNKIRAAASKWTIPRTENSDLSKQKKEGLGFLTSQRRNQWIPAAHEPKRSGRRREVTAARNGGECSGRLGSAEVVYEMLPRSPIQMKRNSGGGGGVKKRVRSGGEKQRRLGFRRSGSGLRAGGRPVCVRGFGKWPVPDCQSASQCQYSNFIFLFLLGEKLFCALLLWFCLARKTEV